MRTDTSWFEGLKWAEECYHEFPTSVAELHVDARTHGKDDEFDRGARDYVRHYKQRLVERPQPQAQIAA